MVAVDAYSSLKELRSHIEDIMRTGVDVRVDSYTSTDLLESDDPQAVVRRHREWANLGLISVERGEGVGVQVAGLAKGRGIDGFTDLLDIEIAANADKLHEARDRETHLAVEVHRFDCSTFVERTAEPALPRSIDVLWVIFRWALAHEHPPVWRLRRGADWEVINDPAP